MVCTFQDYDYLYFVSELPKGGFFYYYLRSAKTFPKDITRFYLAEILLGIQYLHTKGYLYRLLSPDTIMITAEGHIKLKFDFLNSIGMIEREYRRSIEYIPIDFVRKNEMFIESDYWSMGNLLYEMLVGHTPFKAKTYEETVQKMLNQPVSYPPHIDEETRDLLSRLLDKYYFRRLGHEPEDRYLLRSHPFFAGINWVSISARKIRPPLLIGENALGGKASGVLLEELFKVDHRKGPEDGYGSIFRYYGTTKDKTKYLW
jgi:p70 ribosomal S6 kinase/protein kinase X